jgi:hypothetical protein
MEGFYRVFLYPLQASTALNVDTGMLSFTGPLRLTYVSYEVRSTGISTCLIYLDLDGYTALLDGSGSLSADTGVGHVVDVLLPAGTRLQFTVPAPSAAGQIRIGVFGTFPDLNAGSRV